MVEFGIIKEGLLVPNLLVLRPKWLHSFGEDSGHSTCNPDILITERFPSTKADFDPMNCNPVTQMTGQGQNIKVVSDHLSSNLVMLMIGELPDGRETYQGRSHSKVEVV